MKINKISFIVVSLFFSINIVDAYTCLTYSCDESIKYAVKRYSTKTTKRINDYRRTIDTSMKMEKIYHRVESEKLSELKKLSARLILLQVDMLEYRHIEKNTLTKVGGHR